MNLTVSLILLIAAVICFILAALKVPAAIEWRDAGFAFVVASWIAA